MKKTLFAISILAVSCIACSKRGGNPASNTQTSITGKWTVAKIIDWTNDGRVPNDTVAGDPGEYMDFEADGKMYSYDWYEGGIGREYHYDTMSYQVSGTSSTVDDPGRAVLGVL